MPIPRSAFDQGRSAASWEAVIEGFLNSRPSEAFGVLEVAKAIEYPVGRITGAHSLHVLLHRLALQGKIDERVVRTGTRADIFYASMQSHDRRPGNERDIGSFFPTREISPHRGIAPGLDVHLDPRKVLKKGRSPPGRVLR